MQRNIVWKNAPIAGVLALSLFTIVNNAPAAEPPAVVTSIVAPGLSPAFSPTVKQYTTPKTANCTVPVTVTLANPALHRLYIQSNLTASGATRQTWICSGAGTIDVIVYLNWTEVGRYIITPVAAPPPPPTTTTTTTTTPPMDGGGSGGMTPPPPPPSTPPPVSSEPTPTASPLPVPSSLPLPSPMPVDAATAITLLNQATFGPTAASVASVQATGVDYWLEQQFRMPETAIPNGLDVNAIRTQLMLNMANAPDQLRQRVMFALGQIFVVSANKNVNGDELIPFVRLLSNYAFGNYRTLLREVTLSPSMGKYLDLANSRKAAGMSAPNENYPREVMQLFSIGLWLLNQDGTRKLDAMGQPMPTYTQQTIGEVARALTGWTYPTKPGATPGSSNQEYFVGLMEPRPAVHDTGAKTVAGGVVIPAGQTVTKDMDSVVDALFNHPNMPPFVALRLIRSLVSGNPSKEYVTRVADKFVDNGQGVRGDMPAVIRAVLTDPDAAVAGAQDGHVKDPVLHVIGMGRALGAQITDPSQYLYIFANLGEEVLTAPSVFSFYSPLASLPKNPALFGPEFQIYTPALALLRANFIYDILSGQMQSSFAFDLNPYIALAGNPSALVEKVNQTLFFGRMSSELKNALIMATQAVASYNTTQRALGALYLAAISSEYAVFTGGIVQ